MPTQCPRMSRCGTVGHVCDVAAVTGVLSPVNLRRYERATAVAIFAAAEL